jgi:hypothetical protein
LLHKCAGDILEQRWKVDLLLIMAAERGAGLLPGDGEHRHVVEARVIKPGHQMRGAGSGGRDTHAEVAAEFGIGRGHEGGHFLVAGLDEFDLALGAGERSKDAVDAVARVAKDDSNLNHGRRASSIF